MPLSRFLIMGLSNDRVGEGLEEESVDTDRAVTEILARPMTRRRFGQVASTSALAALIASCTGGLTGPGPRLDLGGRPASGAAALAG